MHILFRAYSRFLDGVEKLFYLLTCAVLLALLTVTVGGIVCDMILAISLPWVEETMVLLFGWVILLGAGLIMREHGHVGISALITLVPRKIQSAVYFFNLCLILCVAVAMVYFGIDVTLYAGARQTSLYLDIPFSYFYGAVPVGGFLLLLFCIEGFYDYQRGRKAMFDNLED